MSSSRARCRKRAFTAEEAAELVVEDFPDDSDAASGEDFDELITQEEFFGDGDSSADEDARLHTAASSAEGAVSSDDNEEEEDLDAAAASGSSKTPSSTSKEPPAAKRLRTTQRLVNSIEAALDPENFDPMQLPSTKKPKT